MEYKREINHGLDFRTANTKEYTHCYHAYPAMMIPQVARSLIHEFRPQDTCQLLFDPYVGSGTSLVEAALADMDSVGTDLNPLARLIARTKTIRYDVEKLEDEYCSIQAHLMFFSPTSVSNRDFERISNHNYWYSEEALLRLSYISELIDKYSHNKDFFNIALSEVVREASYTRNGEFKRFRMKEDKIKDFHPDVFALFDSKVYRNLQGLRQFVAATTPHESQVFQFNSTYGIPSTAVSDGSVDLIVTSPPYGDSRTTVAYGQFSRWANEWFNFENAQNLDNILMGGSRCKEKLFYTESIAEELEEIKRSDEKRYFEVVSFLNDYWFSMQNVARTLRKGARLCYVVGNRNVKGVQIPLDYFTAETFEHCGLHHLITYVREIPNKRMPAMTSPTNETGKKVSTMSNEYIVVMEK